MKIILKSLIFLLISLPATAFDFKNIYKVKTFSAANLEINETNLIDDAHASNIVKDFKELNLVLAEQNNELKKKNNKNRKKKRL